MVNSLFSSLIGFGVGGVGIGTGGLVACGISRGREKVAWSLLAVSAGMIFSLLAMELLPESIAAGGYLASFTGIAVGLLFISLLENLSHRVIIITGNPQRSLFMRAGLLFALGIAFHNFPAGFAMGSGLINQPRIGLDLATTMLLHNFPEGLAMSLPLVLAGINRIFIPVMASIVSVPAGLGAFLGANLGIINSSILAFLSGIAIGAIFFVTWHEILGYARKRLCLRFLLCCLGGGLLIGRLFALIK